MSRDGPLFITHHGVNMRPLQPSAEPGEADRETDDPVARPRVRNRTLAALVGAIGLARAVDDPRLSDEILERVARALHRHVQDEGAPSARPRQPAS